MKKRILALLLALTMAFSLLVFPASAAEVVASGNFNDSNGKYNLKWVLTDDGTMTISGSGYITSGLKEQWAEWGSMVKSIVIDRGPTVIQSLAFQSCKNVESVTIPGSVGRIESGAFSQCTSLKHVTIPEGVYTIEGSAFYNCSSLKSVTIPASVTSLGEQAFRFCSGLESVTLSNRLRRIENKVFYECRALKSITIPESVTEIGFQSFFRCYNLTSATIPASVTSIANQAFYECDKLADVYYGGTEEQWNAITIGAENAPLTSATIHYVGNVPGKIDSEPADVTAPAGAIASFSVIVSGDVASYQWQVSENGGDWADLPDGTAATLMLTVEDSMSGNQYHCVVTDKDGNSVTSEAATLTVAKPVVITGDPSDNVGKVGRVAGFVVEAEGEGLTYRWEYSDDNGESWIISGNTSAVAVCKITEAVDGRLYRCVVTDQYGNQATSASATLRVRPELTIAIQPKDYEGKVNSTARFTIGATGENVTYQWQVSDDGGETWTNSSVKATKYSTRLTAAKHERMVRCIVTDVEGCTLTSDAVSMKIAAAAITGQPQDYVGKVNTTAKFTVTATGSGLTYQWQVSDDGGETWTNSSVKDSTYSTKLTKTKDNRMVRCVVTDQFGNEVISDAASMIIG